MEYNPNAPGLSHQMSDNNGLNSAQNHLMLLQNFWQSQLSAIEVGELDFKTFQLPLARIKKVMKTDEDVKMISAEAPIIFAKACEIFVLELTLRAWIHTEESKRRTLQRNDVAAAISKTDTFDFLIDIVPREESTRVNSGAGGSSSMSGKKMAESLLSGAHEGYRGGSSTAGMHQDPSTGVFYYSGAPGPSGAPQTGSGMDSLLYYQQQQQMQHLQYLRQQHMMGGGGQGNGNPADMASDYGHNTTAGLSYGMPEPDATRTN